MSQPAESARITVVHGSGIEIDNYKRIQPCLNLGTLGHVDHGKTTLVQAITGVWTAKHSDELKRGITIKLGYANFSVFQCPKCPPPYNFVTTPRCSCGSEAVFQRKISFVDSPGHEILMTTMLSGAAVMDAAILVIGADEVCPQPQTYEHLLAAEIMGIKRLIVVQNKIDIVSRERALKNLEEIKSFLSETRFANATIIPMSAQHKVNVDVLLYVIQKEVPTPVFDLGSPPRMIVIRSFDVNRPGTPVRDMRGGILGGSIIRGEIRVGDEIEILPGLRVKKDDTVETIPLIAEVVSVGFDNVFVESVRSGGLVGIGTTLDPSLTKNDMLVGNLAGKPGTLPPVTRSITLEYSMFERVVGVRGLVKAEPIRVGEVLNINVGSALTQAVVKDVKDNRIALNLKMPVCAEKGQRVAVSRLVERRWRLIGHGVLVG
ncbi:MAG: translation initiation factor IF-2 subunit gamma [Candidatus Brockarchaeota archaeon]|nr:translation initiation factor IF-2 subunit gamma [Candidatus Brockarchaeota archaeon]